MRHVAMAAAAITLLWHCASAAAPVQTLEIDWAGQKAELVLGPPNEDGLGDSGSITLRRPGKQAWRYKNKIDNWRRVQPVTPQKLPIIPDWHHPHSLVFATGSGVKARTYLVLVGGGYGCCYGSVTILTPGSDGTPKVVFFEEEFSIDRLISRSAETIAIMGNYGMSESVTTSETAEPATTYNPYAVFLLTGDSAARYSLRAAKAYNEAHYCAWAGSKVGKDMVAVGTPDGKAHCRVMSEAEYLKSQKAE